MSTQVEARAEAPALSFSLALPTSLLPRLKQYEGAANEVAGYEIPNHPTAQMVATEMNGYKKAIVEVEDLMEKHIAPGKQVIENAKTLFMPALTSLRAAEARCKALIGAWRTKEEQRIALENAQREEAARKVRQEAEAKAAAERARAAQEAAEQRRKAEEAAAAGNAARAARLQEQARATEENGEAKAQEAQLAAAAQAAANLPVTQAKIVGTQTRMKWVARLKPNVTLDQAKALIVEAIAKGRTDLLGVLDLNESAIRKIAEALHEAMSVPGFEAKNEPQIAGQRK